jgi:hypothetical protein
MDNLRTRRLQNAAHDVNSSVMAIKERGGSYEADFILGLINSGTFHNRNNWCDVKLTKLNGVIANANFQKNLLGMRKLIFISFLFY